MKFCQHPLHRKKASAGFSNAAQHRHQSTLRLKNATAFCTELIHLYAQASCLSMSEDDRRFVGVIAKERGLVGGQ